MAKNSKDKNNGKAENINKDGITADVKKTREEEFGRQLGKIGCAILIIGVAFYFDIPQNLKNIYFLIATALVIYQAVIRIVKAAFNRGKENAKPVNWIEVGVVASTLGAIIFKQYAAAAIFMTICEAIEIIRTRPI